MVPAGRRCPPTNAGAVSRRLTSGTTGRTRSVSALESRIAEVEATLALYSRNLQEGGETGNLAEIRHVSESYASTQAELEKLMSEWMAMAD